MKKDISTKIVDFAEEKDSQTIGIFKIEQLKADSGLYEGYAQTPYNPDIIVQKKGDFSTYDKMRRDDQVKAILWLKKFMILSTGWNINPNKDKEEEQKDVIISIKNILSNLSQPNFGDALTNILSYIDYGFSITEPVFNIINSQIIIEKLKTRAPHTFLLETDDFGNLDKIRQYTAGADIIIEKKDINKLIFMVHQQEFGVPYGVSDLLGCYRAWFSKDIVIRFWNMYLERFGNPHFIAKTPANLSPTERANLITTFKTLQASTGITIPEGVEIDLISPSAGKTGFEKAIDKYNMMIARSMLIPDLIGVGGKEISGGSYALGEKHFDIFYMTISKHRIDLERAINRQIIQPLVKWNFGIPPEEAPKWELNPLDDANKNEYLQLWINAIKEKVWKASDEEINHFRNQVKFPQGDIERPEPSMPPGPTPELPQDIPSNKFSFAQKKRSLTIYERKVDFKKIERATNELDEKGSESLSESIKPIMESFLVDVKPILKSRDIERLKKVKLKHTSKLTRAIEQMLKDGFKEGMISAKSELPIKTFALPESTAELFDEAMKSRAYFISGWVTDVMKKDAFMIMIGNLDKGVKVSETMFYLKQYFEENYVFFKPFRLETIVRTNNIKAYNLGRRKIFEDPDLKGFVQAYQFSAILDDRTTDICNDFDKRIYKANDPYIDEITPPLHYNCRSLFVPIIEGESFEIDKKIDLEQYPDFAGKFMPSLKTIDRQKILPIKKRSKIKAPISRKSKTKILTGKETTIITMPDGTKREMNIHMMKTGNIRILVPKDLRTDLQWMTPKDIEEYFEKIPEKHKKVIEEIRILDNYYYKDTIRGKPLIQKNVFASYDYKEKHFDIYRNDHFNLNEVKEFMPHAVAHETAHAFENSLDINKRLRFLKDWRNAVKLDGSNYITGYAETDIQEDIAETLAHYWSPDKTARDKVKKFPNRLAIFEKYKIEAGGE